MTEPRDQLIRLLDYIEQVEKLKKTAPFKVPTEFFQARQAELQGLPGLEFNLVHGGDDVWLRVPRLKETAPPPVPDVLAPWVTLSRSPDKAPVLAETITVPNLAGEDHEWQLAHHPTIATAFDTYMTALWTPWSVQERPRRKTINLYGRLFAVQQTIDVDGGEADLELVWGLGFSVWKKAGVPATLEYPLLTQVCDITLNPGTFSLEVRPRLADPVLELDGYLEAGVEGVGRLESYWRERRATTVSRPTPFEAESAEPVFRAAVGYLDPGGQFLGAAHRPNGDIPAARESLVVTDSWVLFVRKRSGHLFLQDIERLKTSLRDTETVVPDALSALVTAGSDVVVPREALTFRGLSSSASGAGTRELYFPMPYNAEQEAIVAKLERSHGVVVQGPPGTGKTHTIANVICHFLAQGRRVLVTSRGEEALRVLQEKIPEEIRALSVALLTDEQTGMKQFEHAIRTIAATVSELQPSRMQADIAACETRLDHLHQKIAALDHAIAALAEQQLQRLRHGRPAGEADEAEVSPEELARLVIEEAPTHGWFPDALGPETPATPSVTMDDVGQLRTARARVGADLPYLEADLPAADSLLAPDALIALHRDLARSRRIDDAVAAGEVLPLTDTTAATVEKARAFHALLQRGEALAVEMAAAPRPWDTTLRRVYANPEGDLPRQWLALSTRIQQVEAARRSRLADAVVAPAGVEHANDFIVALKRLCEGKSGFAWPLGQAAARAQVAACRVAGLPPATAEDWQKVRAELGHRIEATRLIAAWNALAAEWGLDRLDPAEAGAFKKLAKLTEHGLCVMRLATDIDRPLRTQAADVFGSATAARLPADPDRARAELLAALAVHLDKGRLAYAMTQVDDQRQKLDGKSGAVVDALNEVLLHELGSDTVGDAELASHWRKLLAELRRLASLRPDFVTILRVTERMAADGAPLWAAHLRTDPALSDGDAWLPANWPEAWTWSRAKTLLEGLEGHDVLKRRFEARRIAEEDLAKTYRTMVAARAWLAVHDNSPESVRQALQEYLNEIQAIGAGTGIRAVHHRQLARAAMEEAYPAVPCWIMPQWRVSESIPPKIGSFDLVVIDEASQSDIWALPALLRGAKVLVVGDHRQVSPSGVGMEEAKIRDLFTRFLTDQPHGSQMRPDRSIYDLATVVFAGNSVMLKEHFRCVPAIIEYSKREFYEHAIKPLRLPKRSERLDPPLIDVHVKGGYRRGDVNEPEARAILAEIQSIIADPATNGRSIGVVTLLGHEQAKRIDELVRRHIPTPDLLAHRIRVGEPTVFQGRESDIMLVSMVLAPGDRGLPNQTIYQQRLNVAASRARDRMILFRSIEESDVNPDSLTARLIAHFRQPFHQDAKLVGTLRGLCESDFEREMYDALTEKGYRVRPQVKVGSYRIDFVVEGAEDRRLAVECDGDRYHGPGQWADDMTRQRVLERAGWTFWRCFASSFVLRRQAVLDDLVATLARLGIEPLGHDSVDTTPFVAHRVLEPEALLADDLLAQPDPPVRARASRRGPTP